MNNQTSNLNSSLNSSLGIASKVSEAINETDKEKARMRKAESMRKISARIQSVQNEWEKFDKDFGQRWQAKGDFVLQISNEIYPAYIKRLDELFNILHKGSIQENGQSIKITPNMIDKALSKLDIEMGQILAHAHGANANELIQKRNIIGGGLIMIPVSLVTFGTAPALLSSIVGTGIVGGIKTGAGIAFISGQVVRTASGDESALSNALIASISSGKPDQILEALKVTVVDVWRGASSVGFAKFSATYFNPIYTALLGKGLEPAQAIIATSTSLAFLTSGTSGGVESTAKYLSLFFDPKLSQEERKAKEKEIATELFLSVSLATILSLGVTGGSLAFRNIFSSRALVPSNLSPNIVSGDVLNKEASQQLKKNVLGLLKVLHPDKAGASNIDDVIASAYTEETKKLTEILGRIRDGKALAGDLETVKTVMKDLLQQKINAGAKPDELMKLLDDLGLKDLVPTDYWTNLGKIAKGDLSVVPQIVEPPASTLVSTPTSSTRAQNKIVSFARPTLEAKYTKDLTEPQIAQLKGLEPEQLKLYKELVDSGKFQPLSALRTASGQNTGVKDPNKLVVASLGADRSHTLALNTSKTNIPGTDLEIFVRDGQPIIAFREGSRFNKFSVTFNSWPGYSVGHESYDLTEGLQVQVLGEDNKLIPFYFESVTPTSAKVVFGTPPAAVVKPSPPPVPPKATTTTDASTLLAGNSGNQIKINNNSLGFLFAKGEELSLTPHLNIVPIRVRLYGRGTNNWVRLGSVEAICRYPSPNQLEINFSSTGQLNGSTTIKIQDGKVTVTSSNLLNSKTNQPIFTEDQFQAIAKAIEEKIKSNPQSTSSTTNISTPANTTYEVPDWLKRNRPNPLSSQQDSSDTRLQRIEDLDRQAMASANAAISSSPSAINPSYIGNNYGKPGAIQIVSSDELLVIAEYPLRLNPNGKVEIEVPVGGRAKSFRELTSGGTISLDNIEYTVQIQRPSPGQVGLPPGTVSITLIGPDGQKFKTTLVESKQGEKFREASNDSRETIKQEGNYSVRYGADGKVISRTEIKPLGDTPIGLSNGLSLEMLNGKLILRDSNGDVVKGSDTPSISSQLDLKSFKGNPIGVSSQGQIVIKDLTTNKIKPLIEDTIINLGGTDYKCQVLKGSVDNNLIITFTNPVTKEATRTVVNQSELSTLEENSPITSPKEPQTTELEVQPLTKTKHELVDLDQIKPIRIYSVGIGIGDISGITAYLLGNTPMSLGFLFGGLGASLGGHAGLAVGRRLGRRLAHMLGKEPDSQKKWGSRFGIFGALGGAALGGISVGVVSFILLNKLLKKDSKTQEVLESLTVDELKDLMEALSNGRGGLPIPALKTKEGKLWEEAKDFNLEIGTAKKKVTVKINDKGLYERIEGVDKLDDDELDKLMEALSNGEGGLPIPALKTKDGKLWEEAKDFNLEIGVAKKKVTVKINDKGLYERIDFTKGSN